MDRQETRIANRILKSKKKVGVIYNTQFKKKTYYKATIIKALLC